VQIKTAITKRKNHKSDIKLNAMLQKYYYTLFPLALCMKGIILWLSLGLFLISGITLLKGQQSKATNYNGSTIPANGSSVVIEEEKEEDERHSNMNERLVK
jgi:hypothetical protein